jgi:transcriptional regulator with XRE-family HTH domain
MNIGRKIRELRQQAGISQETLARTLSMTPQAISRWENGTTAPDISLLPAIASYFGVSIDALFSYDAATVEQDIENFLDQYYALLQESEAAAQRLLQDTLRRYPGREALRLLQCFHLKGQDDIPSKIALCKELSKSKDPTVRTEAIIVLANTYYKIGDELQLRDTLSLLPECDATKLSLSARYFAGEEAMLCAQRQKSCSLANLLDMQLRISELYQERGEASKAAKTLLTAKLLLEALKEDASYQFPKGKRSASTWERFSEEYYEKICTRLSAVQ